MRIGVISDIHNNPEALRAVLDEFARRGVDGVICLGDIIGIGPLPQECVDMVRGIPNLMACVRGNHEGYFLDGAYDDMDDEEREFHKWEHGRIDADAREFLAGLGKEARLEIEGVSIWAGHYPLDGERFFEIDPEKVRDFCPEAQVCLYGHDHSRSVFEENGRIFADLGSLGCPGREKNIARAGILEISGGKVSAEALDVEYDVGKVLKIFDELDPPARRTVQMIFYGI